MGLFENEILEKREGHKFIDLFKKNYIHMNLHYYYYEY